MAYPRRVEVFQERHGVSNFYWWTEHFNEPDNMYIGCENERRVKRKENFVCVFLEQRKQVGTEEHPEDPWTAHQVQYTVDEPAPFEENGTQLLNWTSLSEIKKFTISE